MGLAAVLVATPGTASADGGQSAGPDSAARVIATYRARIPALMAREHVTGLAVVVVDGDRVLWHQGFGSTDDGGAPITADTIFSVQSTSKTFAAKAVMLAVRAGLIDLDVPITTYLPDFTVHSAFQTHPERRITMRMLLSHTAGFTHEAPVGNNYGPEPGTFNAHVRSISATWLRLPVGTGYAYSNLGIDLAGHILEVVLGKPFPVLMRDVLLAPFGMDHSTFDRARVHATANRAVGHSGLVAPPVDSLMTAAGGLWTSAADMRRFLRFQLGNGTLEGHELDAEPWRCPGGAVELAGLRLALAGRARGLAELRHRVLWTHPGEGRPVWVEDPSFDPLRHITAASLPPGEHLATWAANRSVHPLDLGAPLWRADIVDGLPGGRAGVLIVVHHLSSPTDWRGEDRRVAAATGRPGTPHGGGQRSVGRGPQLWPRPGRDRQRSCAGRRHQRPARPAGGEGREAGRCVPAHNGAGSHG